MLTVAISNAVTFGVYAAAMRKLQITNITAQDTFGTIKMHGGAGIIAGTARVIFFSAVELLVVTILYKD
jgi:uncharacterized membrane protein YtjA (UPF0391 family)